MKTLHEAQNKMAKSISFKIIVIGILGLLLLIPAGMIQGLIRERQQMRDEVVQEISDKWGNSQEITGPVLAIPWFEYIQDQGKIQKVTRLLYILPETLEVKGEINPEIRYRGIYKVVVYGSDIKIKGNFLIPSIEQLKIDPKNIDWSNAFISLGIPDMRGIQNEILINWEDDEYHVEPGTRVTFIRSGISSNITINEQKKNYHFQFDLLLNGSQHLYFTPVGKITNVHLTSTWNNPSFTGSYLPDHREVSNTGFVADWQVLHLNRNYPQVWKNSIYTLSPSNFGIDLLLPVDEYQKSYRSTKYAIMFIGLTFIIFLFMEI
ncbi:MAG TPA: cell envelope integrity protein CreD, partial [Bacteroidetes bacterium]|nr:cell envelope integrity protein CreD [Bacteroidota bacterium]